MPTGKLISRGCLFLLTGHLLAQCLAQFEKLEVGLIPIVRSAIGGQWTKLDKTPFFYFSRVGYGGQHMEQYRICSNIAYKNPKMLGLAHHLH